MTSKDLKRLGKKELLELLLEQTERADALQEELNKAKESLEDRSVKLAKAGNIAEAVLQLNNIFEVAQRAADEYIENIKNLSADTDAICERKMADANAKSEAMIAEATAKSETMIAEATAKSDKMVSEATEKVEVLLKEAKAESNAYWDKVKEQLDAYYAAHKGLKELLSFIS